MPMNKGNGPAARGPLAKIAMSRACEFSYIESDPDEGKLISETKGALAVEAFNHSDFDKEKFGVLEWEAHASVRESTSRRLWNITADVMRDGVVIRKSFRFNCGAALKLIKELGQYEKAAKTRGEARKSLKDRGGIL